MLTFLDTLAEKRAMMRTTRHPNPIERTAKGVWVIVLSADGAESTRFLVDEADYEQFVRPYRWHVGATTRNRVYTSARIPTGSGNSTILLHRWLLNPLQDLEVDHVNGDPLDNRRENLRLVSRKQNQEAYQPRRGVSHHRGVHFCKQTQRWRAQVTHNYKAYKSPRFDTEDEAARWAQKKRAELFSHDAG